MSEDRWTRSRALLEHAKKSLAGGVSSPFRARAPVPLFFRDGQGPRLEDVDGNRYIDYGLAWGPMILGYRHPRMVEVLRRQAEKPLSYGAQHELEYRVAEQIQSLVPCAERVAFTSSGSEAVQLALRLCRAFTGRPRVLKFEGHYHGWLDSVLISYRIPPDQLGPLHHPQPFLNSRGQVPNASQNVLVSPWNRLDILEQLFEERGPELAAVIMEPVLCNSGCLLPAPGFLEGVKELCDRHGTLLIFDEIITGFRLAIGGAQTFYGVSPDLATFGKALAGGATLSAVAGRADLLMQIFEAGVAFGGTFNGNPFSLAAAECVLSELSRDGGAPLVRANALGRQLSSEIRRLAQERRIELTVTGFGTAFALHFTPQADLPDYRSVLGDDTDTLGSFLRLALEQGLHFLPDGRIYVSAVHTEKEISQTVEAIDTVFSRLAQHQQVRS